MNAKHPRAGEVSSLEMAIVCIFFLALFAGGYWGSEFARNYGVLAQLAGLVLGAVVMGALAIGARILLLVVVAEPFDKFARWWRPFPPPCENGTCRHQSDYERYELPPELVERWTGLARSGYRCRCGHVYGCGCDWPLLNRFVRVLPDGSLRPYLRYLPFGPWRPDPPTSRVAIPRTPQCPPMRFPTGTAAIIVFAFTTGTAVVTVYRHGWTSPLAWPFVIAVSVVGLISGIAGEYIATRGNKP